MKTISQLLGKTAPIAIHGNLETPICGLEIDSRQIQTGHIYAAISGTLVDGHEFIESCIEKGATGILCSKMPAKKSPDVCYVVVENVAATLGEMCLNFHDRKAENLCIVGTTGTNGKTSVSTLLFDLFNERCRALETLPA